MKKLAILLTTLSILTTSYGQELETLGAGVIDFLLTNPKTANKTNATEAAALNVIGDVLSISAQRKHEMNVANAGRSEIVINTNKGNQATVYSDTQGNVYLLYNGTIYPVSAGLVNQAKNEYVNPKSNYVNTSIENATLPEYNLSDLQNEYQFQKTKTYTVTKGWQRYYLTGYNESVNSIAANHNVSRDEIYFEPYKMKYGQPTYALYKFSITEFLNTSGVSENKKKSIRKVYNSQKFLTKTPFGCSDFAYDGLKGGIFFTFPGYQGRKSADGFAVYIRTNNRVPKYSYKTEIVTTFTCNWAKDFDGQGLGLEDFQGIKRSFFENESLLFVMGYTSENAGTWKLEIYEASTGKKVYYKTGTAKKDAKITRIKKEGEKLPIGKYIYSFTLMPTGNNNVSKSEKFEIIENTDGNTDTEK